MLLLEKIKEKKLHIILIILITVIIGILYSIKFTVKEYVSTSTVLLMKTEKISETESNNLGNLELSNKQISTFREILKSDTTIKEIKKDTGLEIQEKDLSKKIEVKRNSNSDTFKIQVKNSEEKNALEINRKLLEIFSDKLEEVYNNTELYIVDNPHITESIYSISIIISLIKSIILGIVIGLGYIIIIVIKEKNQKINSNIEKEINLKKLIEIPLKTEKNSKNPKRELIAYENKKSNTSKAFKILRSNIQFINVNNEKKNIILVTSPTGKEGKSYIAANIAISFAEVGKKVVLIDSDMNNGRQSKIFNIPNNLGFSNYLSSLDTNGVEIKKLTNNFINETAIKNLNLITSGTVPPNSSELLATEKLELLIKDLSVFYDVVVIDGTSVLTSIDSLIIARIATSTILVSNYRKTKKEELQKSKRDIQNIGGRAIGIIINKVKEKKSKEQIKKDITETKIKLKNNINKFIEILKERKEKSKQKLLTEAIIEKEPVTENKKIIEEPKKEKNNAKQASVKIKNDKTDALKIEEDISKKSLTNIDSKSYINKIAQKGIETIEKGKKTILENSKKQIVDTKIQNKEGFEKVQENKKDTKQVIEKDKEKNNKIKEIKPEEPVNDLKPEINNNIPETEYKTKKNIATETVNEIKNYYSNFINDTTPILKEKMLGIRENAQGFIANIKNKVKSKNESIPNNVIKQDNILDKSNKKVEEIKTINQEKITSKNTSVKEIIDEDVKSDNSVLVIVDAERGFCRVFSKICFAEKIINGFDKNDRFVKDQYSAKVVKAKHEKMMELYGITKKQVQRIDPLIYATLFEYDEYIWLERKMISNKAESYAISMAREYEKRQDENDKEYLARCKMNRKEELEKAEIDIEYKLDNLWKNTKTSIIDKISIKKYSDIYEISKELKTNTEIRKSIENKEFYDDIIKKVENKLEENDEIEEAEEKIGTIEELEEINKRIEQEKLQKEEKEKKIQERKNKNKERQKERKQQNEKKREERLKRQEELKKQKEERLKKQEELKKQKEEEKERQKEEARIEEELLIDNLYPKTKNNRNI